ncbi:MAG TPA: DUF2231 domain-containing protein [Gemmatimonadaceae bacterium]|jgi:uncharacterized membrane protein
MESKARLFGHPIHQMLIVFPLGLLATGVIFDIIGLVTHDGKWPTIAFYMIAAGVIGGLVAAIFGFIDYLAIPAATRAKHIGRLHGLGNLLVVVLFAVSWYLRVPDMTAPQTLALVLSFAGVVLALFTGWLGGELVDRLGVGVSDGAGLDAPSSLSGRAR